MKADKRLKDVKIASDETVDHVLNELYLVGKGVTQDANITDGELLELCARVKNEEKLIGEYRKTAIREATASMKYAVKIDKLTAKLKRKNCEC